jgi:UDP-N-acetyl-D-glucosamine/UDP-N-acetyl-D-galactosamine dehydrogenase
MAMTLKDRPHIAVMGLGYVGLPLARAFSAIFPTIGYDPDAKRIKQILLDNPQIHRCEEEAVGAGLQIASNPDYLAEADIFIVAVPTPIKSSRLPDLIHLEDASRIVAKLLRPGALVIYESTVYPGVTEEICVPILEQSGRQLNKDFFVGYSPERINPGDSKHSLENVVKVTSGSSPEAAAYVDWLYQQIVPAGTFRAASIRVAEAAKVIENTQRDLNIALMNELAIIFSKLEIDTADVLAAARTKWNFLPFEPGLVGGHCISVDPYYLTFRAEESGYHPDVILAGRRINDGMGTYVAERVARLMARGAKPLGQTEVLVMGATFKENCADLRNTRVGELVSYLKDFGVQCEIWEPYGNAEEVAHLTGAKVYGEIPQQRYDAVVMAVPHDCFRNLDHRSLRNLCNKDAVIFDVKSIWPRAWVTDRL